MAHGVIVPMRVVMRIVDQHGTTFESEKSTAIRTRKMFGRQDFGRRAGGDNPTGEQQDVIGVGRLGKIVGRHDNSATRGAFFGHDVEDPLSTDQIETRDRFVEEQQFRFLCETLSHEHPLPLSPRQLAEMARDERSDLESVDGFVHDCAIGWPETPEHSAIGESAHGHHFADRHRQLLVDLGRLQHVCDPASRLDRILTQNTQRSGLNGEQTDDRVEQTRFSGTVRTYERGHRTGGKAEFAIGQNRMPAVREMDADSFDSTRHRRRCCRIGRRDREYASCPLVVLGHPPSLADEPPTDERHRAGTRTVPATTKKTVSPVVPRTGSPS